MKISGIVCVVAMILVPWWGYAQQQEASFDRWRVLTMQEKTGKVCYVTSVPVKKEGKVAKRDQPYVMVTAWGNQATEVSVASGYPYKVGSAITVTIDNSAAYQLYSNKKVLKVAWASTPSEHQKIIDRMLAGQHIVVKGMTQRGTPSQDRYDLTGFSKAYKAMQELCRTASATPAKAASKTAVSSTHKSAHHTVHKRLRKPVSKTSRHHHHPHHKRRR